MARVEKDPVEQLIASLRRSVWATAAATAVLYLVLFVAGGVVYAKLNGQSRANNQRIADIQHSRLQSCRRTYEGIRDVFQPFFPPEPRTAKQQRDLDKFNRVVDRRKARCKRQTRTGGSK